MVIKIRVTSVINPFINPSVTIRFFFRPNSPGHLTARFQACPRERLCAFFHRRAERRRPPPDGAALAAARVDPGNGSIVMVLGIYSGLYGCVPKLGNQ